MLYYRTAAIPWSQIRRNWTVVFLFIGMLVIVNMLVAGGNVEAMPEGEPDVLFYFPLLGTPISAQSVSLAVTQFLRYLAMATIGFPVAFAIAPSDFGVAFRRLGRPREVRLRHRPHLPIPAVAGGRLPVDGRRATDPRVRLVGRGHRLPHPRSPLDAGHRADRRQRDRRRGGHHRRHGPARIRDGPTNVAPACSSTTATDWLVLGFFVALLVAATLGGFLGTSDELWTPQFLIDLAQR